MSAKKSVDAHKLDGTYRKDRHASASNSAVDDDSKAFTAGRLKMPSAFRGTEKERIWRQLFNPLQRRKTLTKADSAVAIVAVEMWYRWEKVAALAAANPCVEVSWLDKNGTEHFKTVEHPAWKMATQLEGRIVAALKEFSATPASRERTKPTKQPAPKQPAAPPPNSYEGLALQLQKLREEQQQTAAEPENKNE
jgi:P27 family predicted phage terminase small subunit